MKMLEQKERETLERLKNTMNEQNIQLERMEQVMTESKQGFYERVSSSVSPKKTSSSNGFQRASIKSGKGVNEFKQAVETHQEEENEDSQEDNYEDFPEQNNYKEHKEPVVEKHEEPLEEKNGDVQEEHPATESEPEPVNLIVESNTSAPKKDKIPESNIDLDAEVENEVI
jgi:hypothetical protein